MGKAKDAEELLLELSEEIEALKAQVAKLGGGINGAVVKPRREIPVRLRWSANAKTSINVPIRVDRPGGEICFQHREIKPGEEHVLDGSNPSIQMYAKIGKLIPVDADASTWVAGL